MSYYTRSQEDIYFLNDKNIVSSLEQDSATGINPIPSKDCLLSVKQELEQKINNLDQDVISAENKLIFGVNQNDGKISAYYRYVTSSDFSDNKIQISQVESLDDKLTSFVKKSGDLIDHLSVENDLTARNLNIYNQHTHPYYTSFKVNEQGILIDLSGKYGSGPDDNKQRQFSLSLENSINDIIINEQSLSNYISNEVNVSSEALKSFVNNKISTLSAGTSEQNNEFVVDVTQTNGKISVVTKSLCADAIPELQQSKIINLTNDLNTLSTQWLKKTDFNPTLSTSFEDNDFKYDKDCHAISLNVQGKILSIDTIDFIKNKTITHANTIYPNLFLWFTISSEASQPYTWDHWNWNPAADVDGWYCPAKPEIDYIGIELNTLTQVYKFTDGLSCDVSSLTVKVDRSKVPFFEDLVELSNDVSSLQQERAHTLTFVSQIEITQDDFTDSNLSTLSGFILNKTNLTTTKLANGATIKCIFSGADKISCFSTSDGLSVGDNDYIIIRDESKNPFIDIKDLHLTGANPNVHVTNAIHRYEFEQQIRSNICPLISTWLSANFDNAKSLDDLTSNTVLNHPLSAKYDISADGSFYLSSNLYVNNKISIDNDTIRINTSLDVTSSVMSVNFRNTLSSVDTIVYADSISSDDLSVLNSIYMRSNSSNTWYKITIDDSVYGAPMFVFEKVSQ